MEGLNLAGIGFSFLSDGSIGITNSPQGENIPRLIERLGDQLTVSPRKLKLPPTFREELLDALIGLMKSCKVPAIHALASIHIDNVTYGILNPEEAKITMDALYEGRGFKKNAQDDYDLDLTTIKSAL